MSEPTAARRYWRSNLLTISPLLALWFVLSFVVPYFAHALSFSVFGTPFGFWMASQGAPLFYVLIVGVYAWRMRRLDRAGDADGRAD